MKAYLYLSVATPKSHGNDAGTISLWDHPYTGRDETAIELLLTDEQVQQLVKASRGVAPFNVRWR